MFTFDLQVGKGA